MEKAAPTTTTIFNLAVVSEREAAQFKKLPDGFRERLISSHEVFELDGKLYKPLGSGSGVIIDGAGHCLTNHHVVDRMHSPDGDRAIGADAFVAFVGSSDDYRRAQLIGSDPSTDIAVLKLAGPNLPIAALGSSAALRPGDVVLAIGAPHGLRQTVTMGVVSATHRQGPGLKYADFIQTDAAINPGNSGGPLINTSGEVVGINQSIRLGAVVSTDGKVSGGPNGGQLQAVGNIGIGYAVPIDLAREISRQLIQDGKVQRGYLGLQLQDAPSGDTSATSLVRGVSVESILPDSPAEKAGLKAGDLIVSFAGTMVERASRLRFMISLTAPGSNVPVHYLRGGKSTEVTITLGDLASSKFRGIGFEQSEEKSKRLEGVTVELLQRMVFDPEQGRGIARLILATIVDRSSPAFAAGLRPGMVILRVAGVPISSTREFESELASSASGEFILLEVADERHGPREITIRLGASKAKPAAGKKSAG